MRWVRAGLAGSAGRADGTGVVCVFVLMARGSSVLGGLGIGVLSELRGTSTTARRILGGLIRRFYWTQRGYTECNNITMNGWCQLSDPPGSGQLRRRDMADRPLPLPLRTYRARRKSVSLAPTSDPKRRTPPAWLPTRCERTEVTPRNPCSYVSAAPNKRSWGGSSSIPRAFNLRMNPRSWRPGSRGSTMTLREGRWRI